MCRAGYPEPRSKTTRRRAPAAATVPVLTSTQVPAQSGVASGGAAGAVATRRWIRLLPRRPGSTRQLTARALDPGFYRTFVQKWHGLKTG